MRPALEELAADRVRLAEAFHVLAPGHHGMRRVYGWLVEVNAQVFRGDTTHGAMRGWSLTDAAAFGPS